MLVNLPASENTRAVVVEARRQNPTLEIVARCEGQDQMQILHDLGVDTLILPELEAGLEIARQALIRLNVPLADIENYTDEVRRGLYRVLQSEEGQLKTLNNLASARNILELNWVTLPENSLLAGVSLKTSDIRRRTGASVVGVMRQGEFRPNPPADYVLEAGDTVALIGLAPCREAFSALALGTMPPIPMAD